MRTESDRSSGPATNQHQRRSNWQTMTASEPPRLKIQQGSQNAVNDGHETKLPGGPGLGGAGIMPRAEPPQPSRDPHKWEDARHRLTDEVDLTPRLNQLLLNFLGRVPPAMLRRFVKVTPQG